MEDSLKGLLITITVIGLFTTAMLYFIVLFPQEEGITFNDLQSNDAYLSMNSSKNIGVDTSLNTIKNSSDSSFNEWDITQGYMGSNAIKQQSSTDIKSYNKNIFSILILMATKVFGANSPIIYALGVMLTLSLIVITYMVIKFVRQGQ